LSAEPASQHSTTAHAAQYEHSGYLRQSFALGTELLDPVCGVLRCDLK
jgi:hypothetical protein